MNKSIEEYNEALNGIHGGSLTNLADMSEGLGHTERSNYGAVVIKNHCYLVYFTLIKLLTCTLSEVLFSWCLARGPVDL